MQNLKISGDASRGWRVLFLTSVDSDSPIETFHHFALFADRRDAEDLLAELRRAGAARLDLRSHWSWEVDAQQVTGLAICGEAPRIVLEATPRPSRRGPGGVKMRGLAKTTSSSGCPLPGDEAVEFTSADVQQLGKLYCWGSSCVQFIVRLRDGREAFVRADRQGREEERFLRRVARPIRGWAPGRSEGFRTVWGPAIDSPPGRPLE